MLSATDRPLEDVIAFLAKEGVEAGYLVPTGTGLEKSILDAHEGLRSFLKSKKFHDYQTQPQGTEAKRIVDGYFVTATGLVETRVSLYRPDTKTGDPRIWVYGLKERARAGNLMAIFVHEDALYICNVSDRAMLSAQGSLNSHLERLIKKIVDASDRTAHELLEMLRDVAHRGWVESLREGPTGVGFTLETLLGIPANSSRNPDYKGIELKAGRSSGGMQTSRTTLFSKVPDWSLSPHRNGLELLDAYGYRSSKGRLQLKTSLKNTPNSLGHYLDVADDDSVLHSMHVSPNGTKNKVLQWDFELLRSAFAKKHKETFWVKAMVQKNSHGIENFRYSDVIHTKGPLLGNFVEMFRLGQIELDYLIHEEFRDSGKRNARDHGYLFKMWQKNLGMLFPPPKTYKLM
jgi:hypothetical protein